MSDAGHDPRDRPPAPTASWRANTVPRDFADLIGQEPMVRTLHQRLRHRPHRAGLHADRRARRRQDHDRAHPRPRAQLQDADGIDQPTVDLRVLGEHCQAIMEGRHVDVIEMDAASHTGIDDIREIIEQRALRAGVGALQGLHHRRSAHAVDAGLQRPAEDAGRAAAACEVHLRHHRNPQGADHGPVALPALRPAPRRRRAC